MSVATVSTSTVLVLTPTLNDSSVTVEVLKGAHISASTCNDLHELCDRLTGECGAVLISEEAIRKEEFEDLQEALARQPAWSDIPLILLTSNDVVSALELFSKSGNVTLLERPFSRLTLIRSVEAALRAREKQYEVRDLLRALNQTKEEAEKANISKTRFLANMSHEIRTPIGAILGFIDLMKNPQNSSEENSRYMGIVERNSHQLLRLIDDILDLSKVEAGKMSIENIQFSLVEMLNDFISVMAFRASEKGIKFHFKLASQIPDIISTDPVRLRQVLANIVGNAIKFTDKGFVELTASYDDSVFRFVVRDTGVGISRHQERQLFQPFSQADASTTRKFGGTGLGLVLSRSLSQALGGKLEMIESAENVGSTFLIEIRSPQVLKAKLVGREALALVGLPLDFQKSKQALRGLKLLLVEDSPDNQVLLSTYLEKEGVKVTLANDGAQGLRFASTERFDVILMDIQMPVLDGHEATRKLRQLKNSHPIIALTAHAMKEEQQKCFESGFNDFLTKPIQRNRLIEVLSRYLPQAQVHT